MVTGGAGFIGSHVVRLLCEEGFDVIVLDNMSTGSASSLEGLDVRVVEGAVEELPSRLGMESAMLDAIIHLGQPSSSPLYWMYGELFHTALREMQVVLEAAYRSRCPVVYASSSSVYAGNEVPWREDMRVRPWDRYSEVKYICERMGELWARRQGVSFIALRLFSVYGEGEEHKFSFANLFTQLIWSALTKKALKIYARGRQARDLVYVDDVARAFLAALQLACSEPAGYCNVFNVGTGRSVTVREMASIISRRGGVKPRVRYLSHKPRFYIMRTQADVERAERVLGWRAGRRPEDVVRGLVEYYSARVDGIAGWSPEPPP